MKAFLDLDKLDSRRQRVEELLRKSEEKFRAVAETANDAIISANGRGNITYFNKSAESMFGYSFTDLIGQPLTILMPERYQEAHRQGLHRYLTTGEARVIGRPVQLTGKRQDGNEFPLELSLASWKSAEGTFFTAIVRDVSERMRIEEENRRNAAGLEAANKELEAFSYSVSHDLRSPLRAIDGFSRILLEEYAGGLPAEARRYLQMVRDNAQQMGRLIDDLLAFARLSRQPLQKQAVGLTDLARAALQVLRGEQEGRRVDVTIGNLPDCQGDPALLKQVFVNLLSNALKFTRLRDPAVIEIGCRDEAARTDPISVQNNGVGGDESKPVAHASGSCPIFVKDNGVGFDPRYAGKLFGVFQRLHPADPYEGTGVGLAIVQRIVHRHGGRVWAEAEVDRGATFYFTLEGDTNHE